MNIDNDTLARDYDALEDRHDILAAQIARIESANAESTPGAVIHRLVDGEHPVLVWREHRGLSRAALAAASGVSEAAIVAIEAGAEPGLRDAVSLARALGKDAEDLLPWTQD